MPDPDADPEGWAKWREEAEQEIEDLQMRNELLQLAIYDRPPLEAYTAEADAEALEVEFMRTWHEHSKIAANDYQRSRKVQSQTIYNDDGSPNVSAIRFYEKAGGLVVPVGERALTTRGTHEMAENSLRDKAGNTVVESTDRPRGFMAWQPETKRIPFAGRGNLFLQSKQYRRVADEELGLGAIEQLQNELNSELEDPSTLFVPGARGHVKVYDRSTLPPARS